MKEGMFIDSFDYQAVKFKPIISKNNPYEKDLFILLLWSDSIHVPTQTFVDFTLSTLHVFFFMILYASSYIVYGITTINFNGICVFC